MAFHEAEHALVLSQLVLREGAPPVLTLLFLLQLRKLLLKLMVEVEETLVEIKEGIILMTVVEIMKKVEKRIKKEILLMMV